MANNQRSGVTAEQLTASALTQKWVWQSPVPPQPAWHRGARWDGYNLITGVKSQRDYDKAFNLISVGGDVFVSSNSEHTLIALNAVTGAVKWRFYTEAPVRIAPAYDAGRVYIGSDDGRVYCVDATTGAQNWSYSAGPAGAKLIAAEHKFISPTPCRTGVLVQNGTAYAGFGLLPWENAYLVALNATTGAELWKKTLNITSKAALTTGDKDFASATSATQNDALTFEGPVLALAENSRIFVPQGRMSPVAFSATDGTNLGRFSGAGGSWALISPDSRLIFGPSTGGQYDQRSARFVENSTTAPGVVASYDRAQAVLATSNATFLLVGENVVAKNRSTGAVLWTRTAATPATFILGGTTLYVGGKNQVLALNADTGAVLATLPATGSVRVLALANGRLFASTDQGSIHCFAP
jgi:outer membrane protein assembly factor BamB